MALSLKVRCFPITADYEIRRKVEASGTPVTELVPGAVSGLSHLQAPESLEEAVALARAAAAGFTPLDPNADGIKVNSTDPWSITFTAPCLFGRLETIQQ